jgi:maltose O-acetyltransferase
MRSVQIHDDAPVHIGRNVRIAMDVCICTGTHQIDAHEREETGGSYALPIRIEDECWISAGAKILPGVTVGRGSTVAAGAMVTKDVEPYVVVGGVPAKVIKRLKRPVAGAIATGIV